MPQLIQRGDPWCTGARGGKPWLVDLSRAETITSATVSNHVPSYTVRFHDRLRRRCPSDAMSAENTEPTPESTFASPAESALKFTDLALSAPLLRALTDVGYESPSPIQAATIPPLLAGRDVLGQAQTGPGKTAEFAVPILAQIDP